MNDKTWGEIFGQNKPTTRPKKYRRRTEYTERNNQFLDDMKTMGCDPNSIVNLALSAFIPKTYNNNFDLGEIIRRTQKQ